MIKGIDIFFYHDRIDWVIGCSKLIFLSVIITKCFYEGMGLRGILLLTSMLNHYWNNFQLFLVKIPTFSYSCSTKCELFYHHWVFQCILCQRNKLNASHHDFKWNLLQISNVDNLLLPIFISFWLWSLWANILWAGQFYI